MFRSFWIWFLQCLGQDPRGIFSFWDGRRWRHSDPIVIARKLWSVVIDGMPFDSDASRDLIRTNIGTQLQKGYLDTSFAVCEAFDILPLAAGGLTELECAQLLDRFEDYLGDVKKNGNGKPIMSPSSDASQENVLPIINESAFGSTSTENDSDSPGTLDTEPKSEALQL